MIQKLKDILVRALTGAVFVACVIGSVLLGAYAFFALFAFVSAGCVFEYCRLVNKDKKRVSVCLSVFGALLLNVAVFASVVQWAVAPLLVAAYLLYVLVVFARELFLQAGEVGQVRYFLTSQVAVAFPFALLSISANVFAGSFSKELLLLLFAVIWINDTFAYLTGIFLGRHRMAERISPKKSWEGFVGGLLFSIGACVVASFLLKNQLPFFALYPWHVWALMAVVIVAFGTMGDFLESLLKRRVAVKDSGNLLPGHGGLLDRFDSLLMASPALYVFIEIVNYFC